MTQAKIEITERQPQRKGATTMIKATYTHTQAIKARAMNAAAREIRDNGIFLTHDQCDEIGDMGQDWLRTRLGLRVVTSDAGVEFLK